MFRKRAKKAKKLIRTALRTLCVILLIHWTFFTKWNNYHYYEFIHNASKHEEIKCYDEESGKLEQKTFKDIEKSFLDQIKKVKERKNEKFIKTWENQEWKAKLDKLWKNQENDWFFRRFWLLRSEARIKYQEELVRVRKTIIGNLHYSLAVNGLEITELDDGNCWERATRDPIKFFILEPLNWVSKILGWSNSPRAEIFFKLTIIKLFLLWISFSYSAESVKKKEAELKNSYLSEEERIKKEKKLALSQLGVIANIFFSLLSLIILYSHSLTFDKTSYLFVTEGSWWWILVSLFLPFIFSTIEEFFRQRRILEKKEIKGHLLKIYLPILSGNLFSFFLITMVFSSARSEANNWLFFYSSLIDFFLNSAKLLFFPPKSQKSKNFSGRPFFSR